MYNALDVMPVSYNAEDVPFDEYYIFLRKVIEREALTSENDKKEGNKLGNL
ncbi:hypothetical protein [Paenibacillus sp. L3-i20]|uniref:hypothetical protein n=1 Tax=Paenibacillus sp. L3-i20 TaxID=2905833 RepID=UPI001EDE01F4|nr:hypothetical protein [Paenibacillus sp. L3-i20]GKU78291.1 hypothetical protein L3i20_v226880 [Paenibacillus sp. L3-i20]